jgi:quinol monooxygenase YgiN
MVSTNLPHFRKSIWQTFKEWCPWNCVIKSQRRRNGEGWQPSGTFTMVFKNEVGGYSELTCGGAQESMLKTWEGPNISFVHFDEARGHRTPEALKMFDGRARILGPKDEPPQIYLTTTPSKHWLFDYFAGAAGDEDSIPLIPKDTMARFADFKLDAHVATVLTSENPNIDPEFVRQRGQTLTEAERRILLRAEWEDESDVEKFVQTIWWDACHEAIPPMTRSEPAIIALDAATGSETPGYIPDCFVMIMVTRHPGRKSDVMVRYSGIWEIQPGQLLDFAPIEAELRRLCREFSVVEVCYDPYQLHDFSMRLQNEQIANFRQFPQQKDRLIADKGLQDLIMSRRIAHDNNPLLRQHIDNSNIKKRGEDGIRIVKRSSAQKVDAAVALSMAADRCMYFNLG